MKLTDVPETELLARGNLACAGCPEMLAFRHVLNVLGKDTIVINATGCLAVITQMGVPLVPHFHVLFENAPAVVSGIDAALRVQGRREGTNLLVVAGDGGTADIGIAALSGAIERNQDFIYVCFDNEMYMNTGGQRSGTTPTGAKTSTTPIGRLQKGESRPPMLRKDMVEIVAAHGIRYVASAACGYPIDLTEKVKKAAAIRGPSYIHCHSPCPTGWGMEPKDTVNVAQMAVRTGSVLLYEIEDGVRKITKKIGRRKPIEEYLQYQARFKHLLDDPAAVASFQAAVDERYETLVEKAAGQS